MKELGPSEATVAEPAVKMMRASAEDAMAEMLAGGAGGAGAHRDARVIASQPSAALADRADRAMLWKASMHLGRQALDGAAAAAQALAVVEDAAEWAAHMAHNLLLQFVCFAPSSEAPAPDSIYLSFQLYHFAPRTTTRALLQSPEEAQRTAARAASGGAVESADSYRPRLAAARRRPGGRRRRRQSVRSRDASISELRRRPTCMHGERL